MRPHPLPPAKSQAGVMLLEALLGILIFTIGIIGLMGMQAAATRATADMKYRAEAALLTEQLINQMWADNHTTLAASYASPGGIRYAGWLGDVTNATTGLPGANTAANRPTVTIVQGSQGPAPGYVVTPTTVTVTVRWQAPGETAAHQYVTTTQLPPT